MKRRKEKWNWSESAASEEDGRWKNMCQTREHVCFMQAKASGMRKRDGRTYSLETKECGARQACGIREKTVRSRPGSKRDVRVMSFARRKNEIETEANSREKIDERDPLRSYRDRKTKRDKYGMRGKRPSLSWIDPWPSKMAPLWKT